MIELHGRVGLLRLDRSNWDELANHVRESSRAGLKALVIAIDSQPGQGAHGTSDLLVALQDAIESSTCPVVAAIGQEAFDDDFELALACHARVALENSVIGLGGAARSELPRAGATQRLPRLIGADGALRLLLRGMPERAESVKGLINEFVANDVTEGALRLAESLSGGPREEVGHALADFSLARQMVVDAAAVDTAIDVHRAKLSPRERLQPVFDAIIEAVSVASGDFNDGLGRERDLARAMEQSKAWSALRYLAAAEQRATTASVSGQAARAVRSLAVIGAGTMGTGIAIAALDAGFSVVLLEQDADALQRGYMRVHDHYRERVSAGKLAPGVAAQRAGLIAATTDWTRLSAVDLVIEAVFEDLGVKQEVFRRIDSHARPGAVLASNTSYLDLDAIASATSRPSDVVGLHFFSPANVMKLVEVVRGAATAGDVLATGVAIGNAMRKMPVVCGNAFGFIGNRIYNAYRQQCEFMLEDGAWPEDVDNALTAMGFAMGPFAVADLSGLDIAWRMRKAQAATRDPRARYVSVLDWLCEQGRLGRKTGAGYYAYADGKRSRAVDDTVRQVIERASASRGIVRAAIDQKEIQRRALLAMVNEAAWVVAEGIASCPSDVDVVLAHGYGFPRWEGGPVYWARQQDRSRLEADLKRLAQQAGFGFAVADLEMILSSEQENL